MTRITLIVTSAFVFACARQHEVRTESSTGRRAASSAGHRAASSAEGASRVSSSNVVQGPAGAAGAALQGMPQLGVHVGLHRGPPVFRADFNCGESLEVYIDNIYVTDPGNTGLHMPIYCLLRSKSGSRTVFTSSGWEYGAELPGYAITGACAPLEKGRKYEVGVTAGGVGWSIFSIDGDGSVRVHQESCQKTPAPKNANSSLTP
jgi:hypothetical protein